MCIGNQSPADDVAVGDCSQDADIDVETVDESCPPAKRQRYCKIIVMYHFSNAEGDTKPGIFTVSHSLPFHRTQSADNDRPPLTVEGVIAERAARSLKLTQEVCDEMGEVNMMMSQQATYGHRNR